MSAGTDGVGTKLMLAFLMNKHDTVGVDLVAMCVNDIIVSGCEPAFFLDYMAMGKQIPERTAQIVSGITNGCEQSQCALIGGEMAEMPGLYEDDEYDLAGFAVGFAPSEDHLILGNETEPDMYLYGLPSSGAHSNGFSLIRRLFNIRLNNAIEARINLDTHYRQLGRTLGEALLEPTRIYVQEVKQLIHNHRIVGMAHITGGGLVENPPRMLPDGCGLEIKLSTWEVPPIFHLIQAKGVITNPDMRLTFNMGIGMVFVSPDDNIEGAIKIGRVIKSETKEVKFIK